MTYSTIWKREKQVYRYRESWI